LFGSIVIIIFVGDDRNRPQNYLFRLMVIVPKIIFMVFMKGGLPSAPTKFLYSLSIFITLIY
jgi:hypothetical protein